MYFVVECEEMRNIKSANLGILHNMIKSDCVNKILIANSLNALFYILYYLTFSFVSL